MEHAFHQNFVDTLEQEHAQAALKQGFQMKGEDMDDYVAKFEHLAQHARYNLNDIQTLDLFTAGLPNALYQKCHDPDPYLSFLLFSSLTVTRCKLSQCVYLTI